MTTGHTSASIDVEVNNSNGTFVSSSSPASSGSGTAGVTAEFGVTTNNVSGYTLSISGPDNTGKLVDSNNADTNTNYISTLALPSGTNSISASEFTNNTNYTNKWGYKPSKYNSNANSNFFPAPTTTATTLDKTTAANGTTTVPNATNDYSIELGAKLDYTVNTGSYSKTFILTAVGNPVSYDITFADNTGDNTVDNIPAKSSSTDGITATSVTLPSGTANIPTRTGYTFRAWCLGTVNTTGNVGTTCTGTEYNAGAEFPINQTTTNIVTLYATWTPNKYTCTKQYRLQNADGTWGSYNTEAEGTGASSTESVDFGTTCSYSKSVADYKNSSDGTNNAQASTSGNMNSTNGITLSLSFYRNTYTLTVNAGTNITAASSTTAAVHTSNNNKYYRWGQDVALSATKATNTTCVSYSTPNWTQSGTAGTFNTTTSATPTFTMGKGNATVTATSTSSNASQTVTLTKGTGVSGINIGGTNYTSSSASLTCGTYNISGNYNSNYEFNSWAVSGNISVTSTSSSSTTLTVSGAGTLTLNGKSSVKTIATATYMQEVGSKADGGCPSTLATGQAYTIKDNRDESEYKVARLADGNCWLLDNLRLDLKSVTLAKLQGNTNANNTTLSYLKTSTSSAPSPYTKYAVSSSWTSSSQNYYDRPMINTSYKNTTTTGYGSGSKKIGVYYNYCAATAGSYCYASGSATGNASQDICPKGWSLPTGGIGTTANFHALCKAYNNNTACSSSQSMTATNTGSLQYKLSTPLSGLFYSGSPDDQGSFGYFWSSRRYDGDNMYRLSVTSSTVYPQNFSNRNRGYSVRCLLQ